MNELKSVLLFLAAAAISHAALKSDIEFANIDGESLKLDAWVPEGKGPFPTVILVHGGGWNHGDKQTTFKWMFEPLTKAGFAWITVVTTTDWIAFCFWWRRRC